MILSQVFLPAALATLVLLVATVRAWAYQRRFVENLGLACAFAVLAAACRPLPDAVRLGALPLALLAAALLVFACAEWKFAPDRGQSGFAWAFASAVRPCLGVSAGVGAALSIAPLVPATGFIALLPAAGALGRGLDLLIFKTTPRSTHSSIPSDPTL